MKHWKATVAGLCVWMQCTVSAQDMPSPIRLNQEGFYPHAEKTAIAVHPIPSDHFFLIREGSTDTVFRGKLQDDRASGNSSLTTRKADFSSFTIPGVFRIKIPGLPASYPFSIRASVHHKTSVSSIKAYYYQRASYKLEEKYAGKWARPLGHPDRQVLVHPSAASAERPAGTVIAAPGGWYDAGDYNKYIVNSGITMGTMLSAYEDYPSYYDTLFLNIPESKNKLPDLLDEILYNLRWMLTMQDPHDGGVYNKCTNAAFDGMVMPHITQLPRYLVQKGTAATLDFAAVMAQASRIFAPFAQQVPGLSDSCLNAAQLAWKWALQHPALAYNQDAINRQFKPAITTGGYGDRIFSDEWFWAAAELYVTTRQKQFADSITTGFAQRVTLPSWGNVRMAGYYSLSRNAARIAPEWAKKANDSIVSLANVYLEGLPYNAFSTVMGITPRDFNWGSNSNAANQGVLLMNAERITRDPMYANAALANLDYLLGRNATGYCFLTGAGSFSTRNPHHRPSVADKITDPVPGLLSGGPNPGRQDQCDYVFTEPETCYTDSDCSFASNEIAINWNAPLVYLSGAMEYYHQKKRIK